ncbi:MAG: hypothetical protein HRT99_04030 [Mycoplasmatales bacterium]|nr:hypothetical protein [Mycoplasmatales bacterium]
MNLIIIHGTGETFFNNPINSIKKFHFTSLNKTFYSIENLKVGNFDNSMILIEDNSTREIYFLNSCFIYKSQSGNWIISVDGNLIKSDEVDKMLENKKINKSKILKREEYLGIKNKENNIRIDKYLNQNTILNFKTLIKKGRKW